MKVVIAMDSFKGSMTSLEAGEAAKAGVLRAVPDAEVTVRPLADGGEGTMESLIYALHAAPREVTVTGPLGTPVTASYATSPAGSADASVNSGATAILDMASTSGLILVPEAQRDPMKTTTRGLGELILAAAKDGCRDFLIGIGGSATNDAGAGMLAALGVSLLDAQGQPIPDGAQGLRTLVRIDAATIDPVIKDCRFRIICDVTNPLCGKNGASYVYGPQKGASPAMCAELDALLARFAELTACVIAQGAAPSPLAETPGAGAAGGLGYAFLAYLNAQLLPGIDVVLDVTRLEDYLKDADILLTGEGRLDAQTANGKAPAGAAALAKKHGLPVIAFAGLVEVDEEAATLLRQAGIDRFYAITPHGMPHDKAKQPDTAKANMAAAVERVFQREIIG